jgi:Sulfotransferase domain
MLKVIGAGLSRTGTFSLKRALEILGFGPCYHMDELFRRPDHVGVWANAMREEPDFVALLEDYVSAVDAPVCHFWRQIRGCHPKSKVILTVRDAESWYASFHATVFQAMSRPTLVPVAARPPLEAVRRLVLEGVFSGRFEDKAYALSFYEAHNRSVVASVEPSDLLVYQIGEGWAPLCVFLAVPVPSQEFPMTNERARFRSRIGLE